MNHSPPKKCLHCKKELLKDADLATDPLNGVRYIDVFNKGFCSEFCYRESGDAEREFDKSQDMETKIAMKIATIHHPTSSEYTNQEKISDSLDFFSQHDTKEEQQNKKRHSTKHIRTVFCLLGLLIFFLILGMLQSL